MGIEYRARVSGTIEIAAEPKVIFGMVTDLPRMGEWSPENAGGTWQKGATEATVGARFLGTNINGRKKWNVAVIVTELTEPTRFAFRTVLGPLTIARWSYDIEATPTGCTVTETWVDTRPPILSFLLGRQITGRHDRATFTRQSIDTTLANLKLAAEAAT
jgi:hypothetical protein